MCPKLTVLWIVHSWLLPQSRVSKVNSALDCPCLIAPSISCVQSWQCSGLSILDCSFNVVSPKLAVLWIFHSWLLLQSRVPKVDSALDCTFLIVPSVFSNVYLSVSLDCPFLIAPSISCAQSWQCSGLSILDCSFNLVCLRSNQEWKIQSTANFGDTTLKEQSRMDNPEHCQLWTHEIEGAIKHGQSRALLTLDTRDWGSNHEWTIQRTVNFGHTRLKELSRMDNPETLTNKR